MKKFVPWIIGLAVVLTVVTVTVGFFSAKQEEASVADWFARTSPNRGYHDNTEFGQSSQYYGPSAADYCVEPTGNSWSSRYQFVDGFNECVRSLERRLVSSYDAKLPSEACFALPEKSRQELECIVAAERPVLVERAKQQKQWREEDRAKREAEQKAQEAKEAAADKAITPSILKSIAVFHPISDAERRQVAVYVSCKYGDNTAGYRVSLREYAKASQKGVRHVEERFDGGRYAICNQPQVDDSQEWIDDDGGDNSGR